MCSLSTSIFSDSFQKYIPNEYYEDLCPNCLVGHTVPVFRQALNEWNMGIVQVFDEFDEEYLVQYLGTFS